MIALPLLWGQAIALLITQQFSWQWFLVIHGYGVLCQIFILYLNDYADEAIDRLNTTYWLSGGSRVIPDGQLTGRQLLVASVVALVGMSLLTVLCFFWSRPWMILFFGLAALSGWGYSLRPLRLSYRGHGELQQGLSCGLLLPVTAFYLQTGTVAHFPWLATVPLCLLFYAANVITALPDVTSDAVGGKRTYPVRHGEQRAKRDALLLLSAACISVALVTAEWWAIWFTMLFIIGPAAVVLLYASRSGGSHTDKVANQSACKRFMTLTISSQLWMMVTWTTVLFWHG